MKKIALGLFCLNFLAYANETIDLGQTIVSGTSFEESLGDISTNVFTLNKDDIEEGGYSDITELFKKIPSIQIQKIGGSSVVDIRGEGLRAKDTVKILLNGIPLNYAITAPLDVQGNTELDSIPLEIIEKIEVIPSGGSILYGDNSSGGIVNIITKKNLDKKYSASIFARYKEDNLSSGVNLGTKVGSSDILVNYTETNKSENHYFGDEDIKNFSINSNTKLGENTSLNIGYNRHESDKDILHPLTKEEYDSKTNSTFKPTEYDVVKDGVNLGLNHKFSDKLQFNFDLGYTEIESKSDMDPSSLLPIPNLKGTMIGDFTDKKINLSPKFKYSPNENLDLIFGYAYENVEATRNLKVDAQGQLLLIKPDVKMTQNFDLEKESHAGFIKGEYRRGNLTITPGYRYEVIKTSMDHDGYIDAKQVSGKPLPDFFPIPVGPINNDYSKSQYISSGDLGFVYNYSDTGRGYYNISVGETTPSINKYINSSLISGNVFELNTSLKNEEYFKNEIGFTDYAFGSTISFAIFDIRKNNEIGMNGVAPVSWEYYNIDKTRRTGVELNTSQVYGDFTFSQNLTFIDSKIESSKVKEEIGKTIPYVSDWNLNLSTKYDINDKLSATLTGNYKSKYRVGGEFVNGKLVGFPLNPEIKDEVTYMEDYSKSAITFDLGLTYKNEGLVLNAGITNIFNEKTMDNLSLMQTGNFQTGTSTKSFYIPGQERSYYAGFSYSF